MPRDSAQTDESVFPETVIGADVPRNIARRPPPPPPQPFVTVEQALVWFTRAQAGGEIGAIPRACQPVAVLHQIDRLWRQRLLLRDHLLVLAHYGRRGAAPRPQVKREARAYTLWSEAVAALEPPLRQLGLLV